MSVSNCCISQGSVSTYLRCGENYYTRFVGNFFLFKAVQEFLKSVKIWQSYRQSSGPQFFLGHSVMACQLSVTAYIHQITVFWSKTVPVFTRTQIVIPTLALCFNGHFPDWSGLVVPESLHSACVFICAFWFVCVPFLCFLGQLSHLLYSFFGTSITNLNEPPRALATSTIMWVRS